MSKIVHSEIRNDHFWGLPNADGPLGDRKFVTGDQITRFYGFGQEGHASIELPGSGESGGVTHYIFVQSGRITLTFDLEGMPWRIPLHTRMSACCPGGCSVHGSGTGVVIRHEGYTGLLRIIGPLEKEGRLDYAGASTTLLCPPELKGDPCLNLLHFPPEYEQQRHKHPSVRFSIVASGSGWCIVPGIKIPLEAGAMFCIPTGGHHENHTDDEAMNIVTFHPITIVGWTDKLHPMLEATEFIKDVEQPVKAI